MAAPLLNTPAARAEVEATIPLGRIGRPEEIGALTVFLWRASRVHYWGTIIIDGGYSLAA